MKENKSNIKNIQPKNSLIFLLVLANLLMTTLVLISNSDINIKENTASATHDKAVAQKGNENLDTEKEHKVLYSIDEVTSFHSTLPTIPLYYQFSDDKGAWFSYMKVEQGETWDSGYWLVSHEALEEANINYLFHNDIVNAIFYEGEYFEIKAVASN